MSLQEIDHNTDLKPCMQLKGGLFPFTTIQILSSNLQQLEDQLTKKIEQAPNFFNNAPIVIDLCNFNKEELIVGGEDQLDFVGLNHILRSKHLIPVAVKNATRQQQEQAILANLAILKSNSKFENYSKDLGKQADVAMQNKSINSDLKTPLNKLVESPVRSGQQIYVPDGDLTVVGAVNNGAELLAEGNIHVYGSLRGRALAGINNNTKARIFCNSLEADLISIAGQFKISENIDPKFWKKSVQIFLSNGKLEITEFL